MADENPIEYLIGVKLKWLNPGADAVAIAKAIADIRKQHGGLLDDAKKFRDVYGSIAEGVDEIAGSYDDINTKTSKFHVALKGVERVLGRVSGTMSAIGIPGFVVGTKYAVNLSKELIKATAIVNRLGLSFSQVQEIVQTVAKETSITVKDAVGLFAQYNMQMRLVSEEGYTKLIKRLKQVVGSNADAMSQLQSSLTSLSQTFPELARDIAEMDQGDAPALEARLKSLYEYNKISQDVYRNNIAIVRGNEQISQQEQQRLDAEKKHLEAINKMRRAWEKIALALSDVLLPIMEKFTQLLDWAENKGANIGKIVAGILASFIAIKGLLVGIKGIKIATKGLLVGIKGIKIATGLLSAFGGGGGAAAGLAAVAPPLAAIAAALGAAVLVGKKVNDIRQVYKSGGGALSGGKGFENIEKRLAEQERQKAAGTFISKKTLNAQARIRAEEEKKIADQLEQQRRKDEEIVETKRKQLLLVEKLNSLYSIQSNKLSTILQDIAARGDLDRETAFAAADATIETLKTEEKAIRDLQRMRMGDMDLTDEGVEKLITSKAISDEAKKQIALMRDNRTLTSDALEGLIKQEDLSGKLADNALKQKQVYRDMTNIHDERLRSLGLEADRASKLIDIANNYAIGVGASVAMRMRLYEAEGQRVEELNRKLATNALAQARAVEAGDQANQIYLANQRKEIENEILDATLKQNEAVKSMRDGWISAISAMQTGAGGFSEIIMNAEQNTAQVMRLAGHVRSSVSGAFARRGGRGEILEDVGFRRSERFGAGGVGSIMGRGGRRQLSYLTEIDKRVGIGLEGPSVLQHRARRNAQKVVDEMRTQGRIAASGGTGLGVDNAMLLASMTQAGPTPVPHAAAADLVGGGANTLNANVVMPGASIHITIDGATEDAIRNGMNEVKQQVGDVVQRALNSGPGNR